MLQKTFFDCEYPSKTLRKITARFLRFREWKITGKIPTSIASSSFVIVAAPHTTWLDLPYTLMLANFFKLRVYWMGKKELFIFPLKNLLMWCGGIPVERSLKNNRTKYYGDILKTSTERIHLVIAPSGTRKKVPIHLWNKGYYYIALNAHVPIVLVGIDHYNKRFRIGDVIFPTGNYENDIVQIEKFYTEFSTHT